MIWVKKKQPACINNKFGFLNSSRIGAGGDQAQVILLEDDETNLTAEELRIRDLWIPSEAVR